MEYTGCRSGNRRQKIGQMGRVIETRFVLAKYCKRVAKNIPLHITGFESIRKVANNIILGGRYNK